MGKWLVRMPAIRPLVDGDPTDVGRIELTATNSDWALIDIPDNDAEAARELLDRKRRGDILDFMPQNTFHKLGEIDPPGFHPLAGNIMGEQMKYIGVNAAFIDAIRGGYGVNFGIVDTGAMTAAAKAAYAPNIKLVNVHGAVDNQGHGTACALLAVGKHSPLPNCKTVVAGNALPGAGGSGSTEDVVRAFRAVAEWIDPETGERVKVISASLGMNGRDPLIDATVQEIQSRMGIPCSAAMGNDGSNVSQAGSPVVVCTYGWGSTTFDATAISTYSSGLGRFPQETAMCPGEVGIAHMDGGYGTGRGTSFSTPLASAIVAGLRQMGWA